LNIFRKLTLLILLVTIINSCTKNVDVTEPIVEIYSPQYNQQFLLPDTISIDYKVEHNKSIEYIRVSIDDKNITPISNQEFSYPDSKIYEGSTHLQVSTLPQNSNTSPYYVHIVVSDYSQVTHTYLEIKLLNQDMKYKGFFLVSKAGVETINIKLFDDKYQSEINSIIQGNYSGSAISSTSNLLYLITNTPELTSAFDGDELDLRWTKEPQLPYPEFNSILADNNIIYLSTAIGRIIGLNSHDGVQIFTTPVLPDTIPINICTTADYLFSDFTLRNGNSKVWVSFYKPTGIKFQVFPVDCETISIYKTKYDNKVLIFCNNNSVGSIVEFDVEKNKIDAKVELSNLEIQHTCQIDENSFLFSNNTDIFFFNTEEQSYSMIAKIDDIITDLKFDKLNNRLIVLHTYKADIYSFTALSKIKTIQSANMLLGAELKYGY
jgi:hypothetical protein